MRFRKVSRCWVPTALAEAARFAPSISDGDHCSIYLVHNQVLHLAATTRGELCGREFTESATYCIDSSKLQAAAKAAYAPGGAITQDAGLTGWVVAFDRPLNIKNLFDPKEIKSHEDKAAGIPAPVWSDRARGYYDSDGKRPILIVPMRPSDGKPLGAVRVSQFRSLQSSFSIQNEEEVQDFANSLAKLLKEENVLGAGIDHYFKIASARDSDELCRFVTNAVPKLFNVDSCSLFLRDAIDDRFVLRDSSHHHGLRQEQQLHFEQFVRHNRHRLFYAADDGSKTSLCIRRRAPVILERSEAGDWIEKHRKTDALPVDSGGAYLSGSVPEVRCEFPSNESRSIILVPVRDVVNPRMLSGLLRVVSTSEIGEQNLVGELQQFATDLARMAGQARRQELEAKWRSALVQELDRVRRENHHGAGLENDLISRAAEIICQVMEATSVTVFLRNGEDRLSTRPEFSVLTPSLPGLDDREVEEFARHHASFKELSSAISYRKGEGRTGWVWKHGLLNLRDRQNEGELTRRGVRCRAITVREIPNPGPFIAAPIGALGATPIGVVRASRRENTMHGSFSGTHEQILTGFGLHLAEILSTFKRRFVISSFSGRKVARSLVEGLIERMGGESLFLEDRTNSDLEMAFCDLMNRACGGIVIVTRDGDDNKTPSGEVVLELGRLIERFPTSTLVLHEDGAIMPDGIRKHSARFLEFPYSGTAGISEVVPAVEKWLKEQIERPHDLFGVAPRVSSGWNSAG